MKKVGEALAGLARPKTTTSHDGPVEDNVCPLCKGAGWLRDDVPVGHHMFGRPIACECLLAKRDELDYEELLAVSNLEPFREQSFESFDSKVPGVDKAYQVAREFARDPKGWLLLRGKVGCGKTHLAAAIANQAIRLNFRALFVVVPELLDHLRSAFSPSSATSYDDRFEQVRGVPLLILDDLGTESSTPWAQEKLFQIFNHRYVHKLPTVITSNRDLNRIDERIASRMTDRVLSQVVEIKSGSYRELEAGQRRRPRRPA